MSDEIEKVSVAQCKACKLYEQILVIKEAEIRWLQKEIKELKKEYSTNKPKGE